MGKGPRVTGRSATTPLFWHVAGFVTILLAAMWLRRIPFRSDPSLQSYIQLVTGLLSFVFAAVALVRFQGTQDRISLILGSGFLLSGMVLTASSVLFFEFQGSAVNWLWAPLAVWVARTLLALLLVSAVIVEWIIPRSRHPQWELGGALLSVVALTYGITASLRRLPADVSRHPADFFPNPQQLLPAVIFLVAVVWYRRRLQVADSAFDRALYAMAWLNFGAQLAACQSERLLDAPFVFSQALAAGGYAVALCGALLDNARLFDQVRHLAVSDPLTGLANYRRLLDVLESETERTNRNERPFALVLLDVDGLKQINDTFGHLVGSRAICRMADILRIHCRAIDTAARYGGDEFALVLPETQREDAERVAGRIRAVLANDPEKPPLSASIGISLYRGGDQRIESLFSEADLALYAEKAARKRIGVPTRLRGRAQRA
jgi:diguanylate cyclase (GGDEF)-like protein